MLAVASVGRTLHALTAALCSQIEVVELRRCDIGSGGNLYEPPASALYDLLAAAPSLLVMDLRDNSFDEEGEWARLPLWTAQGSSPRLMPTSARLSRPPPPTLQCTGCPGPRLNARPIPACNAALPLPLLHLVNPARSALPADLQQLRRWGLHNRLAELEGSDRLDPELCMLLLD